jgi:hypothetical protein
MALLRYVTDIELKRPAPQEKLASEPVRPLGQMLAGSQARAAWRLDDT